MNNMASTTPWKDEKWLPGVLNKRQMIALMNAHLLLDAEDNLDEDASALDLHLSEEGYRMNGSIKPFNKSYKDIITDTDYATKLIKEDNGYFLLKKGESYLFKIKERLNSCIQTSPIYGQATAKSTVGRVDVIARLIVDGMKEYEKFTPKEVDSGEMFLEITPITFNVNVKEGISISQLRFFYGKVEHSIINDENFINSVLNISRDHDDNNGTLSVDISNVDIVEFQAAAYVAKAINDTSIDLWKKKEQIDRYAPKDFWELKASNEKNGLKSILIEKDRFYILRSFERISLPKGVCIYCRAMDETLGEMRIHYAGFVHPLFGYKRDDKRTGTPLIFEVRGHNVKVLLTQREILARLFFYKMSEDVNDDLYYKILTERRKNDKLESVYNEQELNLSVFFKDNWS